MKNFILIAFLLTAPSALASGKVVQFFTAGDPQIGQLEAVVTNVYESANQPLRLTVTLRCNDNRTVKNGARPTLEYIIRRKPICFMAPAPYNPDFNKDTKILTLHYSTSEFRPGQAECDHDWQQPLDLKQLCAAWQPSGN